MGNATNAIWNRQRWFILAAGILVLGAIWAFLSGREPSYRSHSLSYWLSLYAAPHYGWYHPEGEISRLRRDEAREALQQIGPAAIPHLVRRIAYQPTKLRTQFVIQMQKLHSGALGWCIPVSIARDDGPTRADEAELGFKVLGASARRAVPSLARLTYVLHNQQSARRVLRALDSIGPDAFPAIIGVMTNRQSPCQYEAIIMTCNMGTNAWRAAPALLGNLQNSDDNIAYASLFALHNIVPPSEVALSTLSNFLQSPNPQLRGVAANSLQSLSARGQRELANGPAN